MLPTTDYSSRRLAPTTLLLQVRYAIASLRSRLWEAYA
jgi:hypothetical protein